MTVAVNECTCLCHEGKSPHVGACSCTFGAREPGAYTSKSSVDREVEPVLCYVTSRFAWFTTAPLEKQWGDDWNDRPYEHNAGDPYPEHYVPMDEVDDPDPTEVVDTWDEDGKTKTRRVRIRHRLLKFAWEGPLFTPAARSGQMNSPYSVEDINEQAHAWLAQMESDIGATKVAIYPGATVREFITGVKRAGGEVYIPLGDSWRLEGTEAEVLV